MIKSIKEYGLDTQLEIIEWLLTQPGWIDYSGDASTQAALPLPTGHLLRVGLTDSDVDEEGIWVDIYEGLQLKND